mmetsp:Transcript_84429/g.237362  ORF Transcript_84429/g.237362 Transcript_84429/m.237362 type:complete len:283 (-) Transcript_84429:293-1141(-)
MQHKWIANCPIMLKKIAGWKTEDKGLTGCILSTGRANENAKEATEIRVPLAIICASDGRVPSTVIVDIVYAEIIDSNIMISICWTADNSVHRPCRMMSTQALMLGVRVVKGAAVLASPSCTMGVSSMPSISPVHLAALATKAFPCFFCMISCSFLISVCNLPTATFMADIWPITPQSSPRFFLACSSSSIHCCCFDIRSLLFLFISSWAFFPMTCAFCICSCRCSANATSASLMSSFFAKASLEPPPTLALPKPLSKAKPTSASLRAPTSFPPSPHISACTF